VPEDTPSARGFKEQVRTKLLEVKFDTQFSENCGGAILNPKRRLKGIIPVGDN